MRFGKQWKMAVTVAATALVFTCVGAYAANNYGSQSDPLVTVSYLTRTLQPSMELEFDSAVTGAMMELEKQFESELTGEFALVTVDSGKTLKCNTGCEVLFRSGSGKVVGSGLLDVTDGTAVSAGKAMTANHLYQSSADGSGFTATSAVTALVRGTYTVGN